MVDPGVVKVWNALIVMVDNVSDIPILVRMATWNGRTIELEVPGYVDEGMRVIAPLDPKKGLRVWCRVATAAGYHARVVNEERGIDRWYSIDELRIERKAD